MSRKKPPTTSATNGRAAKPLSREQFVQSALGRAVGPMTRKAFRFPVWRGPFGQEELYEWLIPLELRTASGMFTTETFLFDTGSGFTTLPVEEAGRLNIPYDRSRPVTVRGT